MKKSNDIVGNRTRDIPACSAVPQPTAPPRAPIRYMKLVNSGFKHAREFLRNLF